MNLPYDQTMSFVMICVVYTSTGLLYGTDPVPDSIWNTGTTILDTFAVGESAPNWGCEDVAIAQHLKGIADDTIRIATVYKSGLQDSLYLVIGTDTSVTGFGNYKYRFEYAYAAYYPQSSITPLVIGNVDNDEYTDILFTYQSSYTVKKLMWVEWDAAAASWITRDSLLIGYGGFRDITIGDANNDGIDNEIIIATGGEYLLHITWSQGVWDTTYIPLDTKALGVAIGNAHSGYNHNEIYVAGWGYDYVTYMPKSRLWMVTWNGTDWTSEIISTFKWPPSSSNEFCYARDVTVGDIDIQHPGNEVAVCHIHGGGSSPYHMPYQVSVHAFDGQWQSRAWHWPDPSGLGTEHIESGDVLPENPGAELVVTSTNGYPKLFWLAPNGSAWMRDLPQGYATYAAVGDVDRWRSVSSEFVLASTRGIIAAEIRDHLNDIGMYYYHLQEKTSIINQPDMINAVLYNAGSASQTGFSVGYCLKNNPASGCITYPYVLEPKDTALVYIPVQFDFLGMDTLMVFTDLSSDAYAGNDTVVMHIEVYNDSTKAASNFNAHIFPPVNGTTPPYDWTAVKTSGDIWWCNWWQDIAPMYPPGPGLEGYAGARFPVYGQPNCQHARLRTHAFNTGDSICYLYVRLYSYYASWTAPMDVETLIVEYSYDDVVYEPVWKFEYDALLGGWFAHTVYIGEFPANTDMYVGIRATSGGSGADWFIDSVRVYIGEYPGQGKKKQQNGRGQNMPLMHIGPTHFTRTTACVYELVFATDMHITVYNSAGQVIKTLQNGLLPAGVHESMWDGHDEHGRNVPAGIYFIRVKAADNAQTQKIVLIR